MDMSENEAKEEKGYDFLGWNDPPTFSFDSRQEFTNSKKPSLTKRVGLSWNASVPPLTSPPTEGPLLPASAPPRGPLVGPPPPSVPSKGPSTASPPPDVLPAEEVIACPRDTSTNAEETPEVDVECVSSPLNELIEQLFGDKEREKLEIVKRLSLIFSAWKDGKFPEDVKQKLHGIATALMSSDVDEADKLQRGLMIDHSGLCSPWMAAIRKIISAKRLSLTTCAE